ncbi:MULTISPECIES: replication initiator protein A [Halomonadaceae]|nr:replication initiator protein A [Halomonas casei]
MHKNEMTAEEKIYVKEYARPGENENQAYERLLGFRDFEWEARDSEIKRSALAPARYAQKDFFVADILDANPKADTASMEHPLFALRAGDRKVRHYQHNETTIEVRPGIKGLATIHDKDVWIYCISQLIEAMNRGRENVSRTVRFIAYDFMVTTNRRTDGDSYKRMGESLERLSESRIVTNIETGKKRERAGFGLIDSWHVVERDRDNRMVAVEVTLPEWLYRSVKAKHVLTLSRDYFRLRKPLDRRIYELARKHCGNQPKWRIKIATLHTKSGSQDKRYKFRAAIKQLAATNELPDYRLTVNTDDDIVTFYSRKAKGSKAQMHDMLKF